MRRVKAYPVQIWFLDGDLLLSAQYLSNKQLNKTINGCFQAICAAFFYFYGIRNAKFYKYYFDKERKTTTMERFFPCWPLRILPKFQGFGTRQSKWTRKCKEHFEYVKSYMNILLDEYEYRTGKAHGLEKFIEWLDFDAPKIKIPEGKLTKIVLEWKVLNPKYRRKDIIEGFRLQYKHVLSNDGIKIEDFTKRDVPEWLMSKTNDWLE